MSEDVPFVAIGNNELDQLPSLVPGQLMLCPRKGCGKRHRIRDSVPAGIIQAVKCGRKVYMVGIKGKKLK